VNGTRGIFTRAELHVRIDAEEDITQAINMNYMFRNSGMSVHSLYIDSTCLATNPIIESNTEII